MTYQPITPFRRAICAADVERLTEPKAELPPQGVNKWEALRELSVARRAYGLSDRTLTVLQALLSFYPETTLRAGQGNLTVYPSNKTICERLNGMPSSTMRRHLAALVSSGILARRDSPNGKRYVRRFDGEKVAFGFDLAPLAEQFTTICRAAEEERATVEALKHLRETVSLMRRDLAGLASYGAEVRPDIGRWDAFSDLAVLAARELRKKLDLDLLKQLKAKLGHALEEARALLDCTVSKKMSSREAQNEQHYQSSDKELFDPEVSQHDGSAEDQKNPNPPTVPLSLVLGTCPEIQTYSEQPVRHWHQFVALNDCLRPMLGISASAWLNAKKNMGAEDAAIVLSVILERLAEIRSPGAYLRALTSKAEAGQFSCGPMVTALSRRDAA